MDFLNLFYFATNCLEVIYVQCCLFQEHEFAEIGQFEVKVKVINNFDSLETILRVVSFTLILSPLSPLETISTSLWAGLHHHFPVMSVFSHVRCHFIFFHVFPGVVEPSPSRPPRRLLLFPLIVPIKLISGWHCVVTCQSDSESFKYGFRWTFLSAILNMLALIIFAQFLLLSFDFPFSTDLGLKNMLEDF